MQSAKLLSQFIAFLYALTTLRLVCIVEVAAAVNAGNSLPVDSDSHMHEQLALNLNNAVFMLFVLFRGS